MNVSGIRPYEGFYKYNSIKMSQLRSEQLAVEAEAGKTAEDKQAEESLPEVQEREAQNLGAADYAKTYQPAVRDDWRKTARDLNSLDVEQAVSDLGKDQVLKQYQYFVGKNSSQVQTGQSGINPRGMENFDV